MSARQFLPWNRLLVAAVSLSLSVIGVDSALSQTAAREAKDLARSGDYEAATEQAVKDVEDRPYSERNWRLLIELQFERGLYAEARESLENALKRFPSSIVLRWQASQLLRYTDELEQAERYLAEIGELARRTPWRYGDPESRITLGRFFLGEGADARQVLNVFFDPLKKSNPEYVNTYLASGELALSKHDYQVAAKEFEQAAKLDPENAEPFFGLGRAFEGSTPERAEAAFERVLQINPQYIPMLLHQAERTIDAEQYGETRKLLATVHSIHPVHPQAWAFEAVLAHLDHRPEAEQAARDKALSRWPTNPAVDYWIGKKLSDKYRFAEGAAHQQAALKMDEDYGPARFQLSQDLLRLGQEAEGWALAESVATRDQYNVVAHNLLVLKDRIESFTTIEAPGLLIRMDAREARIYGDEVVALLTRAHQKLAEKYEVELTEPVIVELFPEQPDFAIRTFGLPGGAGFLGVCFGRVITANSPASQRETPANWQSVLWHEFCHVITLNKTHNRMPRWLSEGISVYEELEENPTWGQTINATYRQMILSDELTPVSRLSSAFLRPASALHLQFAYYESSLVVRFLVERFGLEALRDVLTDLGNGLPINEALSRRTVPIEDLDREFAVFARQLANGFAPEADWERPEAADSFAESPEGERPLVEIPSALPDPTVWLESHPRSVWAIRKLLETAVREKAWDEVERLATQLDQLVPGQTGASSPGRLLALSYRQREQFEAERTVLKSIAERTSDELDALERMVELGQQLEDWELVLDATRRILPINPLLASVHESRVEAAMRLGSATDLQDSLKALLEMEPIDPAGLHFQLAQSYQATGDFTAARRHTLRALEVAPRYRDALALLVRLKSQQPVQASPKPTDSPVATPQPTAAGRRPDPPPLPESSEPQRAGSPAGVQP